MKFTKMHGCGNDYVYVNLFEETITDPEKLAIAVSDRHFGIGSDGLIRSDHLMSLIFGCAFIMQMDLRQKCAVTVFGVSQNMYMIMV